VKTATASDGTFQIGAILRGEANVTVYRPGSWIELVMLVSGFGALYGAVMGTSAGLDDGRWLQIVYSAVKVPLLLGASFALTVPSFFVLNSLAGLRNDFALVIRTVTAAQAGVAITLASLSPFVALWYASSTDYTGRVLFNGLMFAIAASAGQVLIRRFYRQLIERNPRHRQLRRVWTIVYCFVAIQLGWLLRPFVGQPSLSTHFIRLEDTWGNAYVIVAQMIWHWVAHLK